MNKNIPILILSFILVISIVLSFPQVPIAYYGTVYDAEENAISDVTVIVKDSTNVDVASTITDEEGKYDIIVPWDDPETSEKEGVTERETIRFYVNNEELISVLVLDQGSDNELNLGYSPDSQGSSAVPDNEDTDSNSPASLDENDSPEPDSGGDPEANPEEQNEDIGQQDTTEDSIDNSGTILADEEEQNTDNGMAEEVVSESSNAAINPFSLTIMIIGIIIILTLILYSMKKKKN